MKKYPYNIYLNRRSISEWIHKSLLFNKFWYSKFEFNYNKRFLNDNFELEILKYHYDKKFNSYHKYYYSGGITAFILYCLIANYIQYYEEMKWDNLDIDMIFYMRLLGRKLRYYFWEHIEGGICLILPPDPKFFSPEFENQWLEKKKRFYLLSLQIKNYEKYKNNKFEYLDFDIENEYEIE